MDWNHRLNGLHSRIRAIHFGLDCEMLRKIMRKENKEGCDRRLYIGRACWVNKIRRNFFFIYKSTSNLCVKRKHNSVFVKCTFFCKHGYEDFSWQNFLRIGDCWFWSSKFKTFPREKYTPPPPRLDKQALTAQVKPVIQWFHLSRVSLTDTPRWGVGGG